MYNKYSNKSIKGYASKLELKHMLFLSGLEKVGKIKDLQMQQAFVLQEKFADRQGKTHRAIKYIVDAIFTNSQGTRIAVDIKGYATDVYKIKKKLFINKYPDIVFKEIKDKQDYAGLIT